MTREVLIREHKGYFWQALVQDGALEHLELASIAGDVQTAHAMLGRIYLGRVLRVLDHLQAAFVEIGASRAGFLHASQARVLHDTNKPDADINDCVRSGDTVLVQCTRPPVESKGAQLSADIHIAGRLVVLSPCQKHLGLSRALQDEAERTRLHELAQAAQMDVNDGRNPALTGWVLRTAAQGASKDDLLHDMRVMAQCWDAVLQKAQAAEPPLSVWAGFHPIARFLNDAGAVTRLIVQGEQAKELAEKWCAQMLPSGQMDFEHVSATESLFARYDLDATIHGLTQTRVNLPSGGWVSIEQTQALVAIDVNSGSNNASPLAVNLEAADAIARQIRLRALGGLIAIDFIDMVSPDDNKKVEARLHKALAQDRTPSRIQPVSDFGVVEMTRRRDRPYFLPLLKDLAD